MQYFVGLLIIGLGILVIYGRYYIYNFTGEWSFATEYLGGNGTVVAITLIGALMIFYGTMYFLGSAEPLAQGIAPGPLQLRSSGGH